MPTSLTYEYKIELLYRKVMTSIKLLSRHRNRKQIIWPFLAVILKKIVILAGSVIPSQKNWRPWSVLTCTLKAPNTAAPASISLAFREYKIDKEKQKHSAKCAHCPANRLPITDSLGTTSNFTRHMKNHKAV